MKQHEMTLEDKVEDKVIRESNRIWRMYGNNYRPITPYLNKTIDNSNKNIKI